MELEAYNLSEFRNDKIAAGTIYSELEQSYEVERFSYDLEK